MRKHVFIPALMAAALLCVSQVGNANAYFTTYVKAKGGYPVSWEHHENINESFNDWSKYVSITSKEGSVPVYVRVKAFAGSKYTLEYFGDDWTYNPLDDYFYYKYQLEGGQTTSTLRIGISNIPANVQEGLNFNVVVVYETIPVQVNESGEALSPIDADWTGAKIDE